MTLTEGEIKDIIIRINPARIVLLVQTDKNKYVKVSLPDFDTLKDAKNLFDHIKENMILGVV